MTRLLPLLLLVACGESQVASTCDELCRELVQTCAYEAFPSLDSCRSGCAYDDSNGGDAEAQLACVQDASCDTFAIIECQHAYGPVDE